MERDLYLLRQKEKHLVSQLAETREAIRVAEKDGVLPCPFCGFEAEIVTVKMDGGFKGYGKCVSCGTLGPWVWSTTPQAEVAKEATRRWNRRKR